nr:hypothetical protein [Tanacetum cinerariifolium]
MTMDTTIDQQVAMDEALIPHAKRLRIVRSNFRLLSDIKSKESTLQLVYDVLRLSLFFKDFLVTADVPEIYMQEFWATATIHHHSIRFKMDNKKHFVNLESFREIGAIRKLTDVNINKLHQPWRSFAAIINKCLTGKSSDYDSLRLSQAQNLWGLYQKRNADFGYLMWEDFVYQVEHEDTKRAMRCIILGLRRDDHMFTTIKLASRHQNMQQFGALLPIELTNEDIKNSNTYKEYYAVATGATPPKPIASVRKTKSSFDTTITPPTVAADEGTGSIPGVPNVPTDESEEELSWNSTDEEGDDDDDEQNDDEAQDDNDQEDEGDDGEDDEEDEGGNDEQASDEEEYIHPSLSTHAEEETKDEESFDPIPKHLKILMMKAMSSSVSSQFVTSMLNPTPDAGMESIFETTLQMDVQTLTLVAHLPMSAPTITPSTIANVTTIQQ